LSDINGNGIDDIAVGTDSDNIILVLDDGSVLWSYSTGDKVWGAASIIDIGNQKLVCAGSKDNNMYCIEAVSGELAFMIETGDDVSTSPSAVSIGNSVGIFFGSNDGHIYAVDSQGNNIPGWPIDTSNPVIGSIAFADLDNDGDVEVISTNGGGKILAYHLDGSSVSYFPIVASFPYDSSPNIMDIDGDGDLELIGGTTSSLVVTDVKDSGSIEGYWHTHRGTQKRRGEFPVSISDEPNCMIADVSGDGLINVLDIVQTVNIIMNQMVPSPQQICAADVNGDSLINVLDIVQMVNIVMDN